MRLAIIVVVQLIAASSSLAFDKLMIKEECEAQWKGDYVMQLDCVERETMAGKQVDKIYYGYSDGTTESEILKKCQSDWPKTYVMVVDCYDRQIAAFKALQ